MISLVTAPRNILRCAKDEAHLHVALVQGAGHDEDDVVDHVAVGAVVQKLAQVRVCLQPDRIGLRSAATVNMSWAL